MVQEEFRFKPVPPAAQRRWRVTCEGVDWAHLVLHEAEGEWRLRGLGPLQGLLAAWEHNGQVVRSVPAWLRREAVATLAMTGLARLKSAHETLARIREMMASRARGEETGRAA